MPFYVCPGTSSWVTIAGRTDNCLVNIRSAVEDGLKNGAVGVLNTDWGDRGHWQTQAVSYIGFAYGAAMSWACAANREIDIPAALDAFVFRDRAGLVGKVLYDLGNAYQQPGVQFRNSSLLFWLYHYTVDAMRQRLERRPAKVGVEILLDDARLIEHLRPTLAYIAAAVAPLDRARMLCADGPIIHRELRHAARMLIHGAQTALAELGASDWSQADLRADLDAIEAEHRAIWMLRNRPGGLDDSSARFAAARARYQPDQA